MVRGLLMLLLAMDCIGPNQIASGLPQSVQRAVAFTFSHSRWAGLHPWDLIQPLFLFVAGVAMAHVVAAGRTRGLSRTRRIEVAVRRAAILVLLGVVVRIVDQRQWSITFDDVLAQLGLAYVPALMVAELETGYVAAIGAAILIVDWLLFAVHPVAGAGQVFGHWQPVTNVGAAFDTWFLNLWPRPAPFTSDPGGYTTLNAFPTIVTLLFGVLAGRLALRRDQRRRTVVLLSVFAAAAIAAGAALHLAGVCPIVKRLWTPAWVLFSGGMCLAALAAAILAFDRPVSGRRGELVLALGRNSLLAYLLFTVGNDVATGLSSRAFRVMAGGEPTAAFAVVRGCLFVAGSLWLLWFLFRRRVFLRA